MTEAQHAAVLFIDGAWVAWATIWIVLRRRVKPVVREESVASRALHLVPLGLAALLLFGGQYTGAALSAAVLPRGAWMVYAGAALVALGLAFTVWARLVLAGNWSGTVTLKQSHELVRTGPYSMARHPIYTGLLTALFGTAVAIDAWRGVLACLIVLLAFLRKLRTEEAFMRLAFGTAYDAYARTTPALLPRRIWPVGQAATPREAQSSAPDAPVMTIATTGFPAWLVAELRSDHAGEYGAVQIYRGILAVAHDPELRAFASRHGDTEQSHLDLIERLLPPAKRSRLLPIWRVAGWCTGAVPALFGARCAYATIDAVESFVDRHYQQQIQLLDAERSFPELRAALERCRQDEVHHRDEARALTARTGPVLQAWCRMVGAGSAAAVAAARRL